MNNGNEEFNTWLKSAAEGSASAIKDSSVFAGIVTDGFLKEPLCALQIGLSILMDKPIILIVEKETKIPESLVRVAKLIERVDVKNPKDMDRAKRAIRDFADRMHKEPYVKS